MSAVGESHGVGFVLGIGAALAEARLARGLELADVERETRMRARYLAALEAERFEELPGRAYARAFLRSYASHLGLDADACVAEFNRRRPDPDEVPIVPAGADRRRPRRGRRLALAAVVLAAAVVAVAATVALVPADDEPAPATAAAASPPPPTTATTEQGRHAAAPRAPGATSVTFTAPDGDSWLEVRLRSAGGRVVWAGTLAQGERRRFGLSKPLYVTLGAPQNVRVRLGDRKARRVTPAQLVVTGAGLRRA